MSRWPPAGKSCAGPLPSLPTNYEPNFEIFHAIEPTLSAFSPSRRRRSTMSGVGASISVWQWQPIEEKRRRKAKVRPLFLPSVSLSEERGDGASVVRGPHFRRPPPPSLLLGWSQNLDVPFFPRPLFLLLFFHSLHEHVSLSLHVEFLPPLAVSSAQIRCVRLTATQSVARSSAICRRCQIAVAADTSHPRTPAHSRALKAFLEEGKGERADDGRTDSLASRKDRGERAQRLGKEEGRRAAALLPLSLPRLGLG